MKPSMIKSLSLVMAAALLSGCAALNRVSSEVSSYGDWPADRRASTYAFERLPSQNEAPQAELQQKLEDAARPALEAAGFRPSADAASADVLVQVGARVSVDDRYAGIDGYGGVPPFFYGWRWAYRAPPRYGWNLGYRHGVWPYEPTNFDREVMLVIRDRRSGRSVYETRAVNTGGSPRLGTLLPALFDAAMKDFPRTDGKPRRVETEIKG